MAIEPEERNEQPTQAKRDEARRQGKVPRSRDLGLAFSLLAGFAALHSLFPLVADHSAEALQALWGAGPGASSGLTIDSVTGLAAASGWLLLVAVLPLSLVTCGVSVAAVVLQTGFLVRPEAVAPRASHLNPAEGLRRLFSLRSLARGGFAVGKIAVVVGAGVWCIRSALDLWASPTAGGSDGLRELWGTALRQMSRMGLGASLALVVLGGLEYLFERWHHERDLRMTREELREEIQRLEGSLEYKARRRHEAESIVRGDRKSSRPEEGGEAR